MLTRNKKIPPQHTQKHSPWAPILNRWKKKSPIILGAPIPLAAVPAPIPLVVAPAPIVVLPVVPESVPAVAGMVPPPAPVPLVPVVASRAPPQAMEPTQVEAKEPIHLLSIFVKIVGTEMRCQGRSCEEHRMCGEVLKEDKVVHLRKMQLMVEGKEEMAIAAIWVTDEINCCHVGFVPSHMVSGEVCRAVCRRTNVDGFFTNDLKCVLGVHGKIDQHLIHVDDETLVAIAAVDDEAHELHEVEGLTLDFGRRAL